MAMVLNGLTPDVHLEAFGATPSNSLEGAEYAKGHCCAQQSKQSNDEAGETQSIGIEC